ncbi:formylglycine-generating enzyme family protein [Candidatus Latescibacterota bacterium]
MGGFLIDQYEYPNRVGHPPLVEVTWEEARDLCQARGKRLCTEREWDGACSGQSGLIFGYGATFEPGRCNTPYEEAGRWRRGPGTLASNGLPDCASESGVHDLVGNVWEWTSGWYDESRQWRVARGGSWFNSVNLARCDSRYGAHLTSDYRLDLIGFRCCRTAEELPDEATQEDRVSN